MIQAYKLYTGTDQHSHFMRGTVKDSHPTDAISISFKETPPHSFDTHTAPEVQYVISLTGTLLFETWLGETFILKPGDILIAADTKGSGHKWKMIDDQPWKRAYIVTANNAEINFYPNE